MKCTLNDCMERINQALDYPGLAYGDISHYFDQAIAELNTNLRIGLRPISYLSSNNKFTLGSDAALVQIVTDPVINSEIVKDDDSQPYYFSKQDSAFYVGGKRFETLYGMYNVIDTANGTHEAHLYLATVESTDTVYWTPYVYDSTMELELTDYLPMDVIILFLIPYVCFKFSVRDGSNGALFRDELTQGFQQIQTSYDIPNFVNLVSVAGKKAYTEDVKDNASNLNVNVPLRAIYDSMKIGNAIMPSYGGFYESGGWGL